VIHHEIHQRNQSLSKTQKSLNNNNDNTGWTKNLDHFSKFVTRVYCDTKSRSMHQKCSVFYRE